MRDPIAACAQLPVIALRPVRPKQRAAASKGTLVEEDRASAALAALIQSSCWRLEESRRRQPCRMPLPTQPSCSGRASIAPLQTQVRSQQLCVPLLLTARSHHPRIPSRLLCLRSAIAPS